MSLTVSDRALRRIAWGVCWFIAAMLVVGIPLSFVDRPPRTGDSWGGSGAVSDLLFVAVVVSFPLVGLLILRLQPRNTIGWLLMAIGFVWGLSGFIDNYATYGLLVDPGAVPGPEVVAALGEGIWAPAIGLMGTFLILLYPDGHLPTPRWRPVAWLSAVTMILLMIVVDLSPGRLEESPVPDLANPLGVESLKSVLDVLGFVLIAFPLCIVACAVALVMRFRRSAGLERLQLKWLATAGALVASTYLLTLTATLLTELQSSSAGPAPWVTTLQGVSNLAFILIPVAIGIAILRHGLYGIDVIISKALVFGSLGAFITGVYVAIVVGIGAAIGNRQPSIALSIAATAVVAIAFQPVRERVQRLANHLVYGARATPYEVLSDFSAQMGGTYAIGDLLPQLSRTLAEGLGAASVEVWLRSEDDMVREASWPPAPADRVSLHEGELPELGVDRVVPVRHQGELLGMITVTKSPGDTVTPPEDKMLTDVDGQAGLVLRNVRLLEDLRSSRERLVQAQDVERRRLERDLHDGAQQSLVSVALLVRMAAGRLGDDAHGVGKTLEQASEQLQQAIAELRELARGIHPAILTERGLEPALTSLAERSSVPVRIETQLSGRLPASIEATVYFVVAEALTNAAKYAGASSVTVSVAHVDDELTVAVSDDGTGGADASRGSGLRGLADRVAVVGGELEVESPPDQGTRLRARIPVPRTASPLSRPSATAGVLQGAGS